MEVLVAPESRNESSTTEDGFHRGAQRVMRAMAENPKTTRGVALGLALAIVGTWAGLSLAHSRAQQVSFALVEAYALRDTPIVDPNAPKVASTHAKKANRHDQDDAQDDDGDDSDEARDDDGDDSDDETMQSAPSDHGPASFGSLAAREAAAQAAFATIAEKNRGPVAVIAALEAAALVGKTPTPAAIADARKLIHATGEKLQTADSLMPIAAMREAQLAEDAGDIPGALAAYERITASQNMFLGDDAQLQRARLLLAQNNIEGARTALEFVQTNYPQSGVLDEVRIQLTALDAQAAQSGSPAHTG
jgi:hypothetical protein